MGLFANWKALVSGFPSVLDWNRYTKAVALMRGQNGVRVFLQNGGAVIEGTEKGKSDFEVFVDGVATVGIVSGYAQEQTGSLLTVAAISEISISSSIAIFAVYDLGLSGTSTPGWQIVSGSVIQTASSFPSYASRYRVVPIATVLWNDSQISGIQQHHIGMIPCPDMTPAGTIDFFNSASIPHGWRLMTEAEAFFFVGYKSGHADYGTVGSTGGFKLHGVTENNHAKHWHDTLPNVTTESIGTVTSITFPSATMKTVVTGVNWTGIDGCPTGGIKWCDSENDTDNRPPWYVVAYKIHL